MNTKRSTNKAAAEHRWLRLANAIVNSEGTTTFALALIVALLMLNFILRFPDLGAIIAEYNQF
jgi:hypothetical protein